MTGVFRGKNVPILAHSSCGSKTLWAGWVINIRKVLLQFWSLEVLDQGPFSVDEGPVLGTGPLWELFCNETVLTHGSADPEALCAGSTHCAGNEDFNPEI